jgi:putative ABC transport system ATP-binding protein
MTSLLCKTYLVGNSKLEVLKGIDLIIERGEFTVVSGDSGSGKTTLLNLISGIDRPTSGRIFVFGEDLTIKDEDFLATFRCNNVGFVFQSYNLISTLTVAENVGFPMEWLKKPVDYVDKRAQDLLAMVGLSSRAGHFPFQLSGGEQQRVGFARALANDPPLLLVDEPTGNLDRKTSFKIIEMLQALNDDGKTIVAATHDEGILKLADQRWRLEEGKLVSKDE